MYDVITFGAATRDVFLRSRAMELHKEHGITEACFPFGAKLNVDDIFLETGGGGTNNAVTFARLAKMKTAAVTRIGNDRTGDEIMDALKHERVSTAFVERARTEKTGYSTIILSEEAERTILVFRGASSGIDADEIPWHDLSAKLFHISSLGGNLELLKKIIARAKRIGGEICFNPGNGELAHGRKTLAPLLAKIDVVSLNREEAAELTGKKVSDLKGIIGAMRRLCHHSVVTDGHQGSYSIWPGETLHAAVVPAKRINLTGAGDAFTSAFAAALLMRRDRRAALALGTLNATGVVQHMGAKVGILNKMPSKNELAKVKIKKLSF